MKWIFDKKPTEAEYYKNILETPILTREELDKKIEAGIKAGIERDTYARKYNGTIKALSELNSSYVAKGPRYKIREHPEGGYVVEERRVIHKNITDAASNFRMHGAQSPTLAELERFDPTPVEKYIPLRQQKDNRMVDRRFDTFEQAEYFLVRTASPDQFETHYDGDPLRRITKPNYGSLFS